MGRNIPILNALPEFVLLELLPQNCGKKIRSNKNQAVNLQTNKRKMRQRTRYFLVVLLLVFAKNIFSQQWVNNFSRRSQISISKYSSLFIGADTLQVKITNIAKQPGVYNSFSYAEKLATTPFRLLAPLSASYYNCTLGFVCKKEFEFEKKTSIPLRVRIGSLDYTNYMEQKPNALKPQ